MNSVHLVVPDLFLPKELAGSVCKGLNLPALEKLLARGSATRMARTPEGGVFENLLCELFGQAVSEHEDAPVAAITARYDKLGEGCWLRADPVHLHLDQSRMLLSQVLPTVEDSAAICVSLNEHFSGQGVEFFAPHPQRWYAKTENKPRIRTIPLSQVIGENVREALPEGDDSAQWHGVFNEIQMLLYSHPANDAREMRGEYPVNSVWLWGGARTEDISLQKNFDVVSSDDVLPGMFADVAQTKFENWPDKWNLSQGRQLLAWTGLRDALQRGDLASWRSGLQDFELNYAQPLWDAMRSGKITLLEIDASGGENFRRIRIDRAASWTFWRRPRAISQYSIV